MNPNEVNLNASPAGGQSSVCVATVNINGSDTSNPVTFGTPDDPSAITIEVLSANAAKFTAHPDPSGSGTKDVTTQVTDATAHVGLAIAHVTTIGDTVVVRVEFQAATPIAPAAPAPAAADTTAAKS